MTLELRNDVHISYQYAFGARRLPLSKSNRPASEAAEYLVSYDAAREVVRIAIDPERADRQAIQ